MHYREFWVRRGIAVISRPISFGNPFLGSANMLQKRCGCGIAETSLGFGKAKAFEGGLIETNGFDFFNAVFKNWWSQHHLSLWAFKAFDFKKRKPKGIVRSWRKNTQSSAFNRELPKNEYQLYRRLHLIWYGGILIVGLLDGLGQIQCNRVSHKTVACRDFTGGVVMVWWGRVVECRSLLCVQWIGVWLGGGRSFSILISTLGL